jgi:hypothetical protein
MNYGNISSAYSKKKNLSQEQTYPHNLAIVKSIITRSNNPLTLTNKNLELIKKLKSETQDNSVR